MNGPKINSTSNNLDGSQAVLGWTNLFAYVLRLTRWKIYLLSATMLGGLHFLYH